MRYKDYAPLPGANLKSRGGPYGRQAIILSLGIVASLLLNFYSVISWCMTWPTPLDNYQTL